MTLVLLVETQGERGIAEQLRHLPVRGGAIELRCVATAHDVAAELAHADTNVSVVSGDLHAPDGALLRMLDDPSLGVAALVASTPGAHGVATSGARVLSAATNSHPVPDADADSLGLVYVAAPQVQAVAAAVRDLPDGGETGDILDLVLAALVRTADVPAVTAVRVEPFPAERGGSSATLPEVDADLAARAAARPADGLYSTFVLRRLSARITPWAVRHGVPANRVTTVSAIVGLAGAGAFAVGSYPALVAGALLLQLSLVLDCVDGEIARATRSQSPFGAWLDGATDRVKEYAALAGLVLADGPSWWWVAGAAMVVQTARHMQDFAFDKGALDEWRAGHRDRRPLSDTTPYQRPAGLPVGVPARRESVGVWLRRLAHLPIAERWLVLSVCALADAPAVALVAYLALVSLAWAWTTLGALRRSRTLAPYSPRLQARLAALRDDGALPLRGRSPGGIVGWALPSVLTAAEGAAVLALTAGCAPNWRAAAFGWFAVVAWHRYDVAYRRGGAATVPPNIVLVLGGGWLLRCAALGIAAPCGALPGVLIAGLVWMFLVYVPESVLAGARTARA